MSGKLGKAYFRNQLRRDPCVDSDTILSLRAAALGLKSRDSSQGRSDRPPELVEQTQSTMQTVRSKFWTLALADLKTQLQSVDVELFPELGTFVERLTVAAEAREDFQPLTARLKKNVALVNYLGTMVTANPREIGGLKEVVARDMLTPKGRTHKRAARLIRKEFPRVHAIDPVWLDSLIDGPLSSKSRFSIPGLSNVPFWVWLVLAFSIARILTVVTK
jgi:hypothetical protein